MGVGECRVTPSPLIHFAICKYIAIFAEYRYVFTGQQMEIIIIIIIARIRRVCSKPC